MLSLFVCLGNGITVTMCLRLSVNLWLFCLWFEWISSNNLNYSVFCRECAMLTHILICQLANPFAFLGFSSGVFSFSSTSSTSSRIFFRDWSVIKFLWPIRVRAAQAEPGKSYLRVIDRKVDKIAQRVDICLALVPLRLITNIKLLCFLFGKWMIQGGVETPS